CESGLESVWAVTGPRVRQSRNRAMSEICTASVEGYVEAARDEVARRSGLTELVGSAVLGGAAALAMAGARTMAAALAGLREEVRSRAVEREKAAGGSTEPRLAECVARANAVPS